MEMKKVGRSWRTWTWTLFRGTGTAASDQIITKNSKGARIKVQGRNCFIGNSVKERPRYALVGFDISGKRTRLFMKMNALPKFMNGAIRRGNKIACGAGGGRRPFVSGLQDPMIPQRVGQDSETWDLLFRTSKGDALVQHLAGALPTTGTMYLSANTAQVRGGEMARGVITLPANPEDTKVDVIGYTGYCDRNAFKMINPNVARKWWNFKPVPGLQWAYVRVRSTAGYTAHAKQKMPHIYGWVPVSALSNSGNIAIPECAGARGGDT
ncbi:MAG: hypothetical protein HY827_09345 [Actinobacteria bacterium]|nr:hypothetical protein [Actinomycetota bacterium]